MKIKKFIYGILILFISFAINKTNAFSQDNLSKYIKEGLDNNLVLKQKNIGLEKAIYSLKTANSYFLPSVNLIGEYTSGEGGRSISFPVGDMLNPVYQTLNKLTGTNSFSQLNNVNEYLFPNNFYDVKLRTTIPVLNSDLIFNSQIQSGQVNLKEYEINIYKRELIKEIKVAYYNYLSSIEAIKIYKSTENLIKESKRVYESLIKNGSLLPVYLLRTESELENNNSKILDAENQSVLAKKYFNFLINRDLDSEILNEPAENQIIDFSDTLDFYTARNNREEIMMFNKVLEINNKVLTMNQFYWLPKINFFIDLGSQERNWKFNKDSKYYLLGVQLNLPVFEGFRNQYKISKSELDIKNSELELEKISEQLTLAETTALINYKNAIQNYQSSLKQLKAAESYFNLTMRGYKEGSNTFLETVDARNQLTSSQLLANINKYKIQVAKANYERENANQSINY